MQVESVLGWGLRDFNGVFSVFCTGECAILVITIGLVTLGEGHEKLVGWCCLSLKPFQEEREEAPPLLCNCATFR